MSSRPARRLYVDTALESGAELALPQEQAHYVRRVLRLRPGDELTLFDGRGGEFSASLSVLSKNAVIARVGGHSAGDRESPLAIDLVQGIGRGERMDFVVQKSTELGVRCIAPIFTEFSMVRLDRDKREQRARHWNRVARSACEQCGRNTLPSVRTPRSFRDWLQTPIGDGHLRIVLQPASATALAALERPSAGVELLVGAEGGLSRQELSDAENAGFIRCALGPRTLRTETAALAAIAVLQARWGDLG